MRQRRPATIPDSELEVLKALWERDGSSSVREVTDVLAGDGRELAYTTVQTLLNRLVEKGFVKAEKAGRALAYTPCVSRDELVAMQLDEIADRVCEGDSSPLVLNLAKTAKFSREDIDSFRELLDELEERADDPKGQREGDNDARMAD